MISNIYINDKLFIDNELGTLDKYISGLQDDLRDMSSDDTYNSKYKYLTSPRSKSGNNS